VADGWCYGLREGGEHGGHHPDAINAPHRIVASLDIQREGEAEPFQFSAHFASGFTKATAAHTIVRQ
jgi:hypothetical protein